MYIFLDIDGVLNCERDWTRQYTINPECVKNFAHVVNTLAGKSKLFTRKGKQDVYIILISSWRNGFFRVAIENCSEPIQRLQHALGEYNLRIEDCTLASDKGRQAEIEYYMRVHDIDAGDYVVIDDDMSLYYDSSKLRMIVPNYKTGISKFNKIE